MEASSLRRFRAELNRRQSELLAQITRTELQARVTAERPTDPGDQSAETVNREFIFPMLTQIAKPWGESKKP
jgi:RNA polymerase-binding transcription factor DksA